jgi:hypothetical protein
MRLFLLGLVLALAGVSPSARAHAQGYFREDIVRGVCRKDGCDEFSIIDAQAIRQTSKGTLLAVVLQTYHASYQGRAERGTEEGYVLCSKLDPTLVVQFEGKLVAFHLAPGGSGREPRDAINYYAMYFALCHGLDFGKRAAKNKNAVATAFGYEPGAGQLRSESLARIEDLLRD